MEGLVVFFIFGSAIGAVLIGFIASTDGHLRMQGGVVLGVLIAMAGWAAARLVIVVGGSEEWDLWLPHEEIMLGGSAAISVLLGLGLYGTTRHRHRTMLFLAAGTVAVLLHCILDYPLLAPFNMMFLIYFIALPLTEALFHLYAAVFLSIYLPIRNPPLRVSEVGGANA